MNATSQKLSSRLLISSLNYFFSFSFLLFPVFCPLKVKRTWFCTSYTATGYIHLSFFHIPYFSLEGHLNNCMNYVLWLIWWDAISPESLPVVQSVSLGTALCSLGTISQWQLGQHLVSLNILMNLGEKSEFAEKQRKIGWHLVRQDTKAVYNVLCNNCFWFLAVTDSCYLSACLVDILVLQFCSCKYSPCAGSAFFKNKLP